MGAVVDGITGGLVVLVGVVVAHRLELRRQRRIALQEAVLELGSLVSWVAAGYWASDIDRGPESRWWKTRDQVWALAGRIQSLATGRRYRETLREVRVFLARLGAAEQRRTIDDRAIPPFAVLELNTSALEHTLFPKQLSLHQEMEAVLDRWDRMEGAKDA